VKLHFPDKDNISLEQLITVAKKCPWYLYHDRMMCLMRNQDFNMKNLKQSKLKNNFHSVDSSKFTNFLRLFQNKYKMSSLMKKHSSLSYCFDEKLQSESKINRYNQQTKYVIIFNQNLTLQQERTNFVKSEYGGESWIS